MNSANLNGVGNFMRIPLTICGIRLQFSDSTYSCGFRDSLILKNLFIIICSWIPQTGVGFHTFCCGFRKVACLWRDFEQHSVLAIRPWSRKQQRKPKKNSNVADSSTNLIISCCRIHLKFTEFTVWPRKDT